MTNKCSKCGYEYGEFDIFCARCGAKIQMDEKFKEKNDQIEKNALFLSLKNSFKNKDGENKTFVFFNSGKKRFLDNLIFNLVACMIIISFLLMVILYMIINNQNHKRIDLQYKNLINNPQQIPELKEPKSYSQLLENLTSVESFLMMYLANSQDENIKKQQIFTSYLNELDKLSHISSDDVNEEIIEQCRIEQIKTNSLNCSKKLNKMYKNIGVSTVTKNNKLYIYPDYISIKAKFSKYLSKHMNQYLTLKAKYNTPVSLDFDLFMNPRELVDKICDFEKMFNLIDESYIKDEIEETIYYDVKKLIFAPSIYTTTTQEMSKEFKNAFEYFLRAKKKSALYPLMLSYMDKKRSYSQDNFKNDYPYKMYEKTFEENVSNSILNDIFSQLRKTIFSENSKYVFSYVYSVQKTSWLKYSHNVQISQNEFVMSEPDENNNVSIYSNTFSLLQELNLSKYGKLYLINGGLYIYNSDKLQISKVNFNGRNFTIQKLAPSDVTSLFPGIEVINIDSYSNYNIRINKTNDSANYIVLSRYSQGYNNYVLSAIKGQIGTFLLPNMFSVSGENEVIISFHYKSLNPEITSDNSPAYRFVIRTRRTLNDDAFSNDEYVEYDKKTAEEEKDSSHKPTIMPKIINDAAKPSIVDSVSSEEEIPKAPSRAIQPPKEYDIDDFDE